MCCRAQGQLGAPLTTVNTAKVADRRLSHRRPQSAAQTVARRFPQADRRLARQRDRSQDGVKVWSGAMDVATSSTRTSSPTSRSSRRSASCSPASISSPRRPWTGAEAPRECDATKATTSTARDAMDGRLRPRPDRVLRRRRRPRRRRARSPPPRRSPASRCAWSRATTKCWRPRRPAPTAASISTPACARRRRLGAGPARRRRSATTTVSST